MTKGGKMIKVKLNEIKLDEKYYPRRSDGTFEIDQETVNSYKLNLDSLPPIAIGKDYTLIDGYHRYLAYRDSGKDEIEAEILDIEPEDYLIEAIRRNAIHGLQLTRKQKIYWANELCRDRKQLTDIARLLAVSKDTLEDWTRETRKEQLDERDKRIMELYLACYTEEEIGEIVNLERSTVTKIINVQKGEITSEFTNPPSSFQPYTLLQFKGCDDRYGREYRGRMPGQVIEHLLWYYTEPFDIVLDPMAGSGTTVDVCKAMYRRYQAYDKKKDESKNIQYNDLILQGTPCKPYFRPKLIILDPPYSSQTKGAYSKDDTDFGNMPLDIFYQNIEKVIKDCTELLIDGGYLAFIISPSQVKRVIYDHVFTVKSYLDKHLKYEMRFIVPYTTQQVSGADVKQAQDGRYPLKLHRDLLVYKKCKTE